MTRPVAWSKLANHGKVQFQAAKTRLSELVDRAQAGEEVVILLHGRAVARLVSCVPKGGKRRLGVLRGRIRFRHDWDDPLTDDLLAAFLCR